MSREEPKGIGEVMSDIARRYNELNKTKMSDSEHLQWIHDRIVNVYGENENVDFLIRFRTIINEFLNQNKDGIK